MAWVTPSNVAAGDAILASTWNQNVVENMRFGQPTFTNEAARDAALTSPQEGMVAYLTAPTQPAATGATTHVPSGITTVYNGSAWVCVTEVSAFNGAIGTTSSSSYTTTLGGSPGTNISVTVATGTTALVSITALIYSTTTAFDTYMGVAVSGATTAAAVDNMGCYVNSLGGQTSTRVLVYSGLTAGVNTFTAQYRTAGSTGNIGWRGITVKGIA